MTGRAMQPIPRPLAGMRVVEAGGSIASLAAANVLKGLGAEVISLVYAEAAERTPGVRALISEALRSGNAAERVVGPPPGQGGDWPQVDRAVAGADALIGGEEAIADRIEDYARGKGNCPATRVRLSRFGRDARDALRGLDIQAQALSGAISIVGEPGRAPLYVPFEFGDILAGLHGATAAVAFARSSEGAPGAEIEIASADVLAACTRVYALLYRFYSMPIERAGRRAPGSGGRYPMTILPCRDGSVVLIARSEAEWSRFIEMMGEPPWSREPKFRDPYAMAIEYPDEVDEKVIPWLRQHTKLQLTELAQKYRVAMAPVRHVPEVLADEKLAYRNFFRRAQLRPELSMLLPGMPMQFYR